MSTPLPEISGTVRNRPALARFGALLDAHLKAGMRPHRPDGEPWKNREFADNVLTTRDARHSEKVTERTVSNWRRGERLPQEITPILNALFGERDKYPDERSALRRAYDKAAEEKSDATVQRARQGAAGVQFVRGADQFVGDRTYRPTDARAAADPVRQQLQAAIRSHADELVECAARQHNWLVGNPLWASVPVAANAFAALTKLSPEDFLKRLGDAYPLMTRLGGFLETDRRVSEDPAAMHEPLPPDVHGALAVLVRTAAPWLRGFPTIAAMDDQAGKALAHVELLGPALGVFRNARDEEAIGAADAESLAALGESAGDQGFLARKASARTVASATNLLLAAAQVATAGKNGGALLRRARAVLAASVDEVEGLSEAMAVDLAFAMLTIARAAQTRASSTAPTPPKAFEATAEPIPENVEEQARELILHGRAPPERWRPHIHRLSFAREPLADVSLLYGLTSLQSLSLGGTKVTDVSALSGLTGLQRVYFGGARITDLSPLSGLTGLRILNLQDTQVADVSPLSGLTGLQYLNLEGTKVTDVSPLSGLSVLKRLYLGSSQVTDVSPLSGLGGLQSLNLQQTQVTDVSSLSGLIDLEYLNLRKTQVTDVSPLSGLTELQILSLEGTNVRDVWPLSGLTSLRKLYLGGTQVTDVSPLSGLDGLQRLNLQGTPVTDLSPLSGLTGLQELYLQGTQVTDVSPLSGLKKLHIQR